MPYTPAQRRVVARFVDNQSHTHYHLDWQPVSVWLQVAPSASTLAYNSQNRLIGVFLLSPPVEGVAWLRLVALHDDVPPTTFSRMFSASVQACRHEGIREIAALETDAWLESLVLANGFVHFDNIIHLKRPGGIPPPVPDYRIDIRKARRHDYPEIIGIDHAAFGPHWRIQMEDLRSVMRLNTWCTVAEMVDGIVGYQLATKYHDGMHLTRLATHPDYQGRGIGRSLVVSLIAQFPDKVVTVNTQQSNEASQRVYRQLSFVTQNRTTQVWTYTVGFQSGHR
ncbi:MAG: GNAT family N-acetyltransferase [Chloroflexi bacterium]|nr:GNAT family N-acetyltransferase [Chloroflexota bacterium]